MSPSPSVQVLAALPYKTKISTKYRQSAYRNGQVIQIHESRRGRSAEVPEASIRVCRRQQQPRLQKHSNMVDSRVLVSTEDHLQTQPRMEVEQHAGACGWSRSHVPKVSTTPPRPAKPVIIHTPTSGRNDQHSYFGNTNIDTPPPTPKLRRLSTPDLPDLVGAPFCDCLMERPISKMHCATCRCQAGQ